MPTKDVTVTIYVCSICGRDQEPDADVTPIDVSYPGTALRLDVCPDCWNTNRALAAVLAYGESTNGTAPAEVGGVSRRGAASLRATAKRMQAEKKAAKTKAPKAKAAKPKLISCPEEGCDYGPKLPNVVGIHRSREHGYLSPRGKGRTA